jgi:hypothetical protein
MNNAKPTKERADSGRRLRNGKTAHLPKSSGEEAKHDAGGPDTGKDSEGLGRVSEILPEGDNHRTHFVGAKISRGAYNKLKKKAKAEHRSVSSLLRKILS